MDSSYDPGQRRHGAAQIFLFQLMFAFSFLFSFSIFFHFALAMRLISDFYTRYRFVMIHAGSAPGCRNQRTNAFGQSAEQVSKGRVDGWQGGAGQAHMYVTLASPTLSTSTSCSFVLVRVLPR